METVVNILKVILEFIKNYWPQILVVISCIAYYAFFEVFSESMEEDHGVSLKKIPLISMMLPIIIVFIIPWLSSGAWIDPLGLYGEVELPWQEAVIQILLYCVPSIILSYIYLLIRTKKPLKSLAAVAITFPAAVLVIVYLIITLFIKLILLIIGALAGAGFEQTQSSGGSGHYQQTYKCPNCNTSLGTVSPSSCPTCGANFG